MNITVKNVFLFLVALIVGFLLTLWFVHIQPKQKIETKTTTDARKIEVIGQVTEGEVVGLIVRGSSSQTVVAKVGARVGEPSVRNAGWEYFKDVQCSFEEEEWTNSKCLSDGKIKVVKKVIKCPNCWRKISKITDSQLLLTFISYPSGEGLYRCFDCNLLVVPDCGGYVCYLKKIVPTTQPSTSQNSRIK